MQAAQNLQPHAIVIGSGFGGLAAAVRLGAMGYRVTVLERRDQAGGRAYVHKQDGFTFDSGPTVVTAPQLFEELWELCGKKMSDHVRLNRVDPYYAVRFHDGTVFHYTADEKAMREQVRAIAPADLAGYEAFRKMSDDIFEVGFKQLSDVPFDNLWSMARIAPQMLRLRSHKTVYGLVSDFIRSEKLRQVLSFHTLLVGGNPFTTTSIYALIDAVQSRWGVHFPDGGVGSLVNGLLDLVRGQGGVIRFGADVEEILVKDKRAVGVRLKGGETIDSQIVVSNADTAYTYRHLVPEAARKVWTNRKLDSLKYSMSLFVWHFGTRRRYDNVAHHTILLGPRYKELLDDIFERLRLAEDFSLYLHRPTATDRSLAPEGHDAFYVLSPVPHLESGVDWQRQTEPYRQAIEAYLQERLLPGLRESLVTSYVLTPDHFKNVLLSIHGAAFSLQPILTQSAYFRPHNESEDLRGLYLVGAGTHPGAGLPGVLSSAKILDRIVPHVR